MRVQVNNDGQMEDAIRKGLTPLEDLRGGEASDVLGLASEARSFITAQPRWCKRVVRGWLYKGFAHLAVFMFEIDPDRGADRYVWVITGDVPPAYIDITCRTGLEAVRAYIFCMKEWADAAGAGKPVADLIPVFYRKSLTPVPPTPEFARELARRMDFIEGRILPLWEAEDGGAESVADV